MIGNVDVTPEIILVAATELDLVAERLVGAAGLSAPATHILPSGADEASLLAAEHMNRAAGTHDHAVAQCALELHHCAATLRTQLAQYLAEDAVSAGITALTGAPFNSVAV